MRAFKPALGLALLTAALRLQAVDPIPECQQARLAVSIMDAYQAPYPAESPKKLRLVYFTPADREPAPDYERRLSEIMDDIAAFYSGEMKRLGFGLRRFHTANDNHGKPVFVLVRGKEKEADFPRWIGRNHGNTGDPKGGDMVLEDCRGALKANRIDPDHETVLIFCHLAKYDPKARTFKHRSPYFGVWTQQSGLCFAADWANQDLANLTKQTPRLNDGEYGDMSLGRHTSIFLGGIAHELGHAFALPHCGERWDEKHLGTSLMGAGNHTYREERRNAGKGSYLTMASALRLVSRPVFSGSDKNYNKPGTLSQCTLTLSTNVTTPALVGRRGGLRLVGTVVGSPPIYGVVAYFDSLHDGGYRSPTATSVPNSEGEFAIEISDLASCQKGDLRIEFCHANGAVSERHLGYAVESNGGVDLRQWEMQRDLEPIAKAVSGQHLEQARIALAALEATRCPDETKTIGRTMVTTLGASPKLGPSAEPDSVKRLVLGNSRFESAEVGWLKPAANRIPINDQIESPFLDCGKLYASGLFAHSPSRYTFKLDGRWLTLKGEAGIHTLHQPYAAGVVFIIKTDGKEAFRSPAINGDRRVTYSVKLKGVKTLELVVENAGDRNNNNWSLWLDPTLYR